MLEGKELEGKLGVNGSYSVDIDDKGLVTLALVYGQGAGDVTGSLSASVQIPLVVILEKAAAKTTATWDDNLVKTLETLAGVKPSEPKA